MINVLTIEREYGSGAAEIAGKLADRLEWKLWDQYLTDRIARRLECESRDIESHEERKDPAYYGLFKAFLRGSYEGSLNAHRLKVADADTIRRTTEQLVRSAGDQGNCVIVGRGSAYYLQDLPNAFHIFIYAPLEEKVRRLQSQGKSEAEAIQLATTVDLDRAAFVKQYFGIVWPARQFFHLMLNSAMGDEAVVQTVLDGLAAVQKVSA